MHDLRNHPSKQRLRGLLYFATLFLALRFTGRGDPLEVLETTLFPESKSFAAASVPLVPFRSKQSVSASPLETSHLLLLLHDRNEVEPITIYHSGAAQALIETGVGCIGGRLRGNRDTTLATEPVVASLEVPPRSLVVLTAKMDAEKADFSFSSSLEERTFGNPGDISFHTDNAMRGLRFFYGALTVIFTLTGLTIPRFSTLVLQNVNHKEGKGEE